MTKEKDVLQLLKNVHFKAKRKKVLIKVSKAASLFIVFF